MTAPDEWDEEDIDDMEFELQQLELLEMELDEEELNREEDLEQMELLDQEDDADLEVVRNTLLELYMLQLSMDEVPPIETMVSVSQELMDFIASYREKYPKLWDEVKQEHDEAVSRLGDLRSEEEALTDEEKEI